MEVAPALEKETEVDRNEQSYAYENKLIWITLKVCMNQLFIGLTE